MAVAKSMMEHLQALLINGDGITARLLKEHGIKITGETTLDITE